MQSQSPSPEAFASGYNMSPLTGLRNAKKPTHKNWEDVPTIINRGPQPDLPWFNTMTGSTEEPDLWNRHGRLSVAVDTADRNRLLAGNLDLRRFSAATVLGAGTRFHQDLSFAANLIRRTFLQYGWKIDDLPSGQLAELIRSTPIRLTVLEAIDFWALVEPEIAERDRLLEALRAADPEPWRNRLRDTTIWENKEQLRTLMDDVVGTSQPAANLQVLAILAARQQLDPAPMMRAAVAVAPADFSLHYALGSAVADRKEAIGAYRSALAIRPDATAAHTNLGRLYVLEGQREVGILEFEAALKQDPNNITSLNNLGHSLLEQGRFDEAETFLRKAIKINSRYSSAHNNLGLVLERKGDDDAAANSFKEALRHNRRNIKAIINLARPPPQPHADPLLTALDPRRIQQRLLNIWREQQ